MSDPIALSTAIVGAEGGLNFDLTTWIALAGVLVGSIGAVLGIMNTWRQMQREKVCLRVTPMLVVPQENGNIFSTTNNILHEIATDEESGFGIEVVNLSEFAVTISHVGFLQKNGKLDPLIDAQTLNYEDRSPQRLEPRTVYRLTFSLSQELCDWKNVKKAYAKTQCGEMRYGNSEALKGVVKKYDEAKNG